MGIARVAREKGHRGISGKRTTSQRIRDGFFLHSPGGHRLTFRDDESLVSSPKQRWRRRGAEPDESGTGEQ
jgi:hypothetical protein